MYVASRDGGVMPGSDGMVANPAHAELIELRRLVLRRAQEIDGAYDEPAAAIGGGDVWVGPSATAWGEELSGRKRRLRRLADRLIANIDAQLASTPERIPEAMAHSMPANRWF